MSYYLNCLYKIKYYLLICLYGDYYASEKIDKKQIYEDKLNNTSKLKPKYGVIITPVIISETSDVITSVYIFDTSYVITSEPISDIPKTNPIPIPKTNPIPIPKTNPIPIPKTNPIPIPMHISKSIPMHISKSIPNSKIVYIDEEYGQFVYLD
jgi:hypothetical protein